jgi:predicted GNAT family acetyltransferase
MWLPLQIRRATQQDAKAIIAIDDVSRSSIRRTKLLGDAIATDTCWIAEADEAIAAYAILNYSFFSHGFIPLVYVHSSFRRHGLATTLMRRLEGACVGTKLFTSANRSNQAMRKLLANLGYQEVGCIDGLDEGDPEVFYLKTLGAK